MKLVVRLVHGSSLYAAGRPARKGIDRAGRNNLAAASDRAFMWRLALLVLGVHAGCAAQAIADPDGTSREALECPSSSVEGIDVFDGQGTIDWDVVGAQGLAFAVIKATQGTYNTQATFEANWEGARRAGLFRSAYHFFDPTEDGAAQAAHFLSVLGPPAAGDLPPTVDMECPDGDASCLYPGASGDAPPADIAARLSAFLEIVGAETGQRPILYTFADYLLETEVTLPLLADSPLFLAHPSADPCFDVPAPWVSATLVQYSWTGWVRGIDAPVDRDRFLGTLDALRVLAARSEPPRAHRPPALARAWPDATLKPDHARANLAVTPADAGP